MSYSIVHFSLCLKRLKKAFIYMYAGTLTFNKNSDSINGGITKSIVGHTLISSGICLGNAGEQKGVTMRHCQARGQLEVLKINILIMKEVMSSVQQEKKQIIRKRG